MGAIRKAVYLTLSFAALATVLVLAATTARAQSDPFGALYTPPPGTPGAPPPSNKTGVTGVTGAVGRTYAGASTDGFASLQQISMLPRVVPTMSLPLKAWNGKFTNGRPRIVVPTYVFGVVRSGSTTAYSAGRGSEIAQRRTSLSTALVGVPDELAAQLAQEAYDDLIKRLKAAGFDVVSAEELAGSAEIGRLKMVGTTAKGMNGWSLYAPAGAPMRSGHPFTSAPLSASGASIVFNDVSAELDAVVITPMLAVDYQQLESTGQRMYSGSAQVGASVRFSVVGGSGANFLYGKRKGLGGGMGGSFTVPNSHGTDEPFAIMYEVNDRSDSVAIHNAFALAGMGSIYRQSKAYAVEVAPERYAALVRAAYQGLNMSLVAEIRKARGG